MSNQVQNDYGLEVGGAAAPPPTIPDYQLLRCVGRGAYGEVWLACNLTGSFVAVKVVRGSAFDHERPFEREFEGIRNFEPISRSDPSQVPILHVGRGEDFFYYVMELADDANVRSGVRTLCEAKSVDDSSYSSREFYVPRTLREDLKRHGRLPVHESVRIGLALTRALAHLHNAGLVHRDVKPSNVIFVGGVPKLADIGLVTSMDATRSFVGTEGYVAPEGPGTPQADLYSLGKLLYEMSTGCDRKQFPALPSDIVTRSDRQALVELNAVVTRACQFDPRDRYGSAEAMQAELAILQGGASVTRRRRWQGYAHALSRAGMLIVALGLGAAAVGWFWQKIASERLPQLGSHAGLEGTQNREAREAYGAGVKAMSRGTLEGFRQALEDFTAATKADSRFRAAQARLFEIYLMSEDYDVNQIYGKEEELKNRAANLAKLFPGSSEAHAALAIVRFLGDWNWREAETEFKLALAIDPDCRMALTYYGYFLTRLGRAKEARPYLERALAIDPGSPLITKFLGHCEYVQRHYQQALTYYQRASEIEPAYPGGHYWAGRVYLALTNYTQAFDEFEEHELKQDFDAAATRKHYAELHKALKDGPGAVWLKCLEKDSDTDPQLPYWYAECYARLGKDSKALERLQQAAACRDTVEDLLVDDFWDRFRDNPKFKEVLHRVGLDAWAH